MHCLYPPHTICGRAGPAAQQPIRRDEGVAPSGLQMAKCPFPLFGSSGRPSPVKVELIVATSNKSVQPEMESAKVREGGGELKRERKESEPSVGWL